MIKNWIHAMKKGISYFFIGLPFGIIIGNCIIFTINSFEYAYPPFIVFLSYLLLPAYTIFPIHYCSFVCGIYWLIVLSIEMGMATGLIILILTKIVGRTSLKNHKLRYSIIIFLLIFIPSTIYIAAYPYLGGTGKDDTKRDTCFDFSTTIEQMDECLLSFVYGLTHGYPEFDLPDVKKHCDNVQQKEFNESILNNTQFADWINYTGFNQRDYCYYFFSRKAYYIEKYSFSETEIQIQICQNLITNNDYLKRDMCLYYITQSPIGEVDSESICSAISDSTLKQACMVK